MSFLNNILYFVAILANIIIGILIYLKNRKNKINILFGPFVFNIIAWLVSLFAFYTINDQKIILIIGRLNFVFTILMVYFLFLFVYIFPAKIFHIPKWANFILFFEVLILSLLTIFTPLIDKDEIITNGGRITVYGPLYFLFVMHYAGFVITSIGFLVYKLRILKGLAVGRCNYLFLV